jgi:probable F420-dependent oxidoreductase
MDFGLAVFPTDETLAPDELARLAEERGFESLFFPEHTHIPASRETPYPAGGELPREYARTYDPFVALTAAAAATERIKVGTGICLAMQRDPIVTAKAAASIDRLSGGRFLFGVGAGWNEEEMRNHGTDPATRFARLRESVEAIRAIWTTDEASYAGDHVSFERIWCWPKPVQDGGPPVLLGGNGPKVLDRVLAYADEWMPNPVPDDETVLARVAELRERADAAGRSVRITLNASSTRPERLAKYADAGVERALFYLPSAPGDEVEQRLERVQGTIDAVRGRS